MGTDLVSKENAIDTICRKRNNIEAIGNTIGTIGADLDLVGDTVDTVENTTEITALLLYSGDSFLALL